jgi:hypothetical protein
MSTGTAFLCVAFWLATGAAAADREGLLGTWEVQGGAGNETWSLESKKEVQTIVRKQDGKVTLNLTCRPREGECTGVDAGKKARVSMYFNGPALVHWEVRDTNLIVRRFFLDGQVLTIEAKQVTGQGKPSHLRLVRRLEAAAGR